MNLEEINFADISLVEVIKGTPHCKKHGAMNKMTKTEDGGGYWRCITVVSNINDTVCRAGCKETRNKNKNPRPMIEKEEPLVFIRIKGSNPEKYLHPHSDGNYIVQIGKIGAAIWKKPAAELLLEGLQSKDQLELVDVLTLYREN